MDGDMLMLYSVRRESLERLAPSLLCSSSSSSLASFCSFAPFSRPLASRVAQMITFCTLCRSFRSRSAEAKQL